MIIFLFFLLEDTQALKSKKTELRLYCDLLMQEIHKVKTIGNRENDTSTTSSNGGDELDETMVKATCDTFIQTLDELMELADQQYHIYGNHRDRVSKSLKYSVILPLWGFSNLYFTGILLY